MFSNPRSFAVHIMITLVGLVCWSVCLPAMRGDTAPDSAAGKAEQEVAAKEAARQEALAQDVTQGALRIVQQDGQVVECPLRHTDVQADVSGFIARVKVTQTFHNPTKEKIEAVYVFPLPHEGGVDDMTMVVGERKIVGVIKKRAEARIIYEQALAQGQTAALLEQERPNIFTQSVGNIGPGQEVKIEISYVDVLRYDLGQYEFHFPMVVGPRYNPGAPIASPTPTPKELAGKVSPPQPDTTRVPDASRISPPVLKPGLRNGHDVMVRVKLDAGVPIQGLQSTNHQVQIARDGDRRAAVELAGGDTIPNKDFVLRYDVVGSKPEMAVLAHTGRYSGDTKALGEGYFMLMIQPKEDERLTKSPPREIVFLVDVSGSMSGEPIAKASACMREMAKICRPEKDTLQVITFAGDTTKLFDKPVASTEANIAKAVQFAEAMQGGGGTEMLKGIKAAIDEPLDNERVRIVVMLTDGYIGNEAEIIEHVGKNCGDQVRFWAVGIGQAPNMFLVDGVAKQGGGMGKKLGLRDDANALAQEVMTRIQRAQLAKVKIDWGGLDVVETYPAKIPELWAGRPVILFGRYRGAGDAAVNVSGMVEAEPVSWPLQVKLPESEPANDVLAKVWARQKIEDLMQQSFYAGSPEVEEVVTALALDYKLMSQYTSFVAVDSEKPVEATEAAAPPRRMLVPVPLPEGTRWEGFFGELDGAAPGDAEPVLGLKLSMDSKSVKDSFSRSTFYANGRVSGIGGGGFGGGAGAFLGRNGTSLRADSLMLSRQLATPQSRRYAASVPAAPLAAAQAGGLPGPASRSKSLTRGVSSYAYARGDEANRPSMPVAQSLNKAIKREFFLGDQLADDESEILGQALGYTQQGLQANLEPVVKAAAKVLNAAKEAQKNGRADTAREQLTRAFFLDQSAVNVGASAGAVAAEALTALETLHADQLKVWSKEMPELSKKLDLVLRDQSLEESLARVAKAAGLSIKIVPGSLADAAALTGAKDLRVTYLDLRHATVAQALDWLLQPERLSWWTAKGTVTVGSERRRGGNSAWVYDVSLIALPDGAELQKLGDWQKGVAAAQREAAEFSNVVRGELGAKENDASIVWFAAGQLLVIGTPERHARAARLLANLADDKARLAGPAAALHKLTAKRFSDRKAQAEKSAKASALVRVANAHEQFGWQLLAAAAAGVLDVEALTELQIAWQRPETAQLLKGEGRAVVLRSWWIASEALPAIGMDEKELAALVQLARSACEPAARDALATLEKEPNNPEVFAAVLYSALAMKDREFTAKLRPLLTKPEGEDNGLAVARTIASALLTHREQIDTTALASVVSGSVTGEDLTVLLAMACRRTGGDIWNTFRGAAIELIGQQPLDGHVVVLINRLAAAQLPSVVQR
jgi:Ca-activated chloride channel family protein